MQKIEYLMGKDENAEYLNILKRHDTISFMHSKNVAYMAEQLLPYFKFKEDIQDDVIIEGALMHDIGKICVPKEILQKKEKLTVSERKIVNQHPLLGRILLEEKERSHEIKQICLLHHEKLDGSGYPQGLVSTFIPDYCRFITTIDVLDALMHSRPYKNALKRKEIYEELKKMDRGIGFDMYYFYEILKLMESGKVSIGLDNLAS